MCGYKRANVFGEERLQPDFDNITAADLRDDERLRVLYLDAVHRKFWSNTTTGVLDFWSFAEKALHEDQRGTPGKLFYALVKAKNMKFVTDKIEQRAMQRMGSSDRQELVNRAAGLNELAAHMSKDTQFAFFGDKTNIGYHHGVMMQCFLPQKALPFDLREYEVHHGRATMVIEAGRLANPEKENEMMRCGLPYGSRARLIIPYINSYAVIRKTREIDLGESLRRFMDKIGSPINGYNGKKVTEQVQALAACQFILGEWSEEGAKTKFGRFTDEISFWIERDENQHLLWQPSMILSERYYDALQSRHVPINMDHLVKLTRSARRMDLYSWLSYRLPAIKKGRVVRVHLRDLRPIFAPDIQGLKHFKMKLCQDLKAIANVYQDFNINVEDDILLLGNSRPPIPSKLLR